LEIIPVLLDGWGLKVSLLSRHFAPKLNFLLFPFENSKPLHEEFRREIANEVGEILGLDVYSWNA